MKKYGLTIGNNLYPGTGSDLSGCINDAAAWTQALEARQFSVRQTTDASRATMLWFVSEAVGRARYGDLVVITYSGHGSQVPDTSGDEPDRLDEGWVPSDIMSHRKIITDDELNAIFSRKAFGVRLVVISDSCYSGTVTRASAPWSPVEGSAPVQNVPRFLPAHVFLGESVVTPRSTLAVPTRARKEFPLTNHAILLSGCSDEQVSYDAYIDGRYCGAFTNAAVKALERGPRNYREWHRSYSGGVQADFGQSPQLYGRWRQKRWRVFA